MNIDGRIAIRTLQELLLDSFVGCKCDDTFDSIEILGDAEKPSLDEFRTKYNELLNVVIPLEELRLQRTYKLTETDWRVGNDSPLSPEKIQEWRIYRQALRDLPTNTTDPENPVWPEAPN
jgi:hypothetical protein